MKTQLLEHFWPRPWCELMEDSPPARTVTCKVHVHSLHDLQSVTVMLNIHWTKKKNCKKGTFSLHHKPLISRQGMHASLNMQINSSLYIGHKGAMLKQSKKVKTEG